MKTPTPSRSIKKIVTELADAKTQSEVNLEAASYKLRPGLAVAKQDAANRLDSLKEEYRLQLGPRTATIFLHGTAAAQTEFAELAVVEGGTLTVDSQEAYRLMAADVELTMGRGRQFGSTQVNILIRCLEDLGRAAGLSHMVVPRLMEVLTVQAGAPMVAVVKEIILTQVGESFNCHYIQARIMEMAMAAGYGEKILPVVLTGAEKEEAVYLQKNIFSGRGIRVGLDEAVTPEEMKKSVLQAFDALKAAVK